MKREQQPMGTVFGDALPGAPALAGRGRVTVGFREVEWSHADQLDVGRGKVNGAWQTYTRTLRVAVWYPAIDAGEDYACLTDHMGRVDLGNLKPFTMASRSLLGAEADTASGKHPVVVISHGYPGSRMLLSNLAENLSSKGYIVIAPGHTDNTYEDFLKERSMESAMVHRTLDQRFVIDKLWELASEGFLRGMLDLDRIALVGFSMGGFGALRTLGAKMCQDMVERLGDLGYAVTEPAWQGDSRVKAAVLFAPATMWFDECAVSDITAPTLWICGTADRTVHYDKVRAFAEKCTRSDRVFVSYIGCGHNVANNPAPVCAQSESWEIYKRWGDSVWDTWKLNNLNAHFMTAFLDARLLSGDGMQYLTECDEKARRGFLEGTDAGVMIDLWNRA